jgi:hypothetical protein
MLENKLSRVGWGVAGLTENKTKPSSWGLAELGKITFVDLYSLSYNRTTCPHLKLNLYLQISGRCCCKN